MKDSTFEAACPCCGSRLVIDGDERVILSHEPPKAKTLPKDLREAVNKLQEREAERESVFDRALAQQKDRGDELERRFSGLLKQQKGKKATRVIREFDLD